MERRVLLAIFLSFLVLYSYQAFFVKPAPKKPAAAPAATSSSTETVPAAAAPNPTPAPAPALTVSATPAPGATAIVGETEERAVRVETPRIVAVFTNRGGRLKSWRLKAYKDIRGEPLELVATDLEASQPLPFSLRAADDATTGTLNGALYAVRGAPAEGVIQTATSALTFEYRDSSGLASVKEFRFDPATYTAAFRATVSRDDRALQPALVWGPGLGDSDSQTGRYAVKPGALYSTAGKVSRLAVRALNTQPKIGRAHV